MIKVMVKKPKGRRALVAPDNMVLKGAKFSLLYPLLHRSDKDPAELIAAAHANNFTLALASELGLKPSSTGAIMTTVTLSLEELPVGRTITNIHLNVVVHLAKISQTRFIDATVRAKTNCMVSRSLRAKVSMTARLEG